MDFTTALKCSDLMEKRDTIITMRQKATEGEMRGWSLAIDDKKYRYRQRSSRSSKKPSKTLYSITIQKLRSYDGRY